MHRQIVIRSDGEAVVENAAAIGLDAGEIEEAVIGQVDDGRLVGHRGKRHRKFRGAGNAVGEAGRERAGIAFLAVRADIGQRDERRGFSPVAVMLQFLRSKPFKPPWSALAPSLVGS